LPWLILIAGPNGAGKTTLTGAADFQNALKLFPNGPARLLNPDDLARLHSMTNPQASQDESNLWAANEIPEQARSCIAAGVNVVIETVLSSNKYEQIFQEAQAQGYSLGMIYLALESAAVSEARVANRVASGGHSVPKDRIRPRFERSLNFLVKFSLLMDGVLVYLSTSTSGLTLLAEKLQGQTLWYAGPNFPELKARLGAVDSPQAGPGTGGMPFPPRP
jgi:predicted ABC-type ATPase